MDSTRQLFTSVLMCFILTMTTQTFASFSPNQAQKNVMKYRIEKLRNLKKRNISLQSKQINHSLAKRQTAANTVSEVYIEERWNGQEWEKVRRDSIVYSTKGTIFGQELEPSFEQSQNWDGSKWVNDTKWEIIYPEDLTRRGISEWDWDNSSQSWKLSYMSCGKIDTLDNNGNEITLRDASYSETSKRFYFTANEETDDGFISYQYLIFTQEGTIDSSEMSKTRWIRQSNLNDTIEYRVDEWDSYSDTWYEGVYKVFRYMENDFVLYDSILVDIEGEWKLQELDKFIFSDNSFHAQYSYYDMWFDPDLQEWEGEGTIEFVEYLNNSKITRYIGSECEWNPTTSKWEIIDEYAEEYWFENGTILESFFEKSLDEETGEWFGEGSKDTLISPFQEPFYKEFYFDCQNDSWKPFNRFSVKDSTDNIIICLEEILDDETNEWYSCSRRIGHLDNSDRIIEEIEQCYMGEDNHDCCGYLTDYEIGCNFDTRKVYSYNEKGLLESETEWQWSPKQQAWLEDVRFVYPYGKEPSLDSKISTGNKHIILQKPALDFNPVKGLLSVYTPVKQNVHLDIFTFSGKKVYQINSVSSGIQTMDIRSIIPASGHYLAQLRTPSGKASTKIMLIR
ncbi:MAG: T9SS type A sorting domain-containing protein [Fibrobacter sp.]|nr:T9SS type A sorting domain-containing protein [Fibrobacter sp.]